MQLSSLEEAINAIRSNLLLIDSLDLYVEEVPEWFLSDNYYTMSDDSMSSFIEERKEQEKIKPSNKIISKFDHINKKMARKTMDRSEFKRQSDLAIEKLKSQ